MKTKAITLIIILSALCVDSFSQMYTKPNEPTFNYLTINPTNGQPTLFWTAPATNPQYPDPIGYIIYRRTLDNLGNDYYLEIDTVNQTTFQYTDVNANGNQSRLFYKISSLGLSEPSRLTPHHAQIWLQSQYDSCNAKIDLTWNFYEGWNNTNIYQDYSIYMGHDNNWPAYTLLANVNKFTNRYSITNVDENQDYYFYITARRTDQPYTTYSNLNYINSKMAIHPTYMTLDSILAENNKITIHYKIDPATAIRNFKLVRWEYPDTNKSIFSAKVIDEFSDPNQTLSVDTNDMWAARTRKFYYKVDAHNGCKTVIKTTNLCNTIIPKGKSDGTLVKLEWDTLMIDRVRQPNRVNNRVVYNVYRRAYKQTDDINGPGELTLAASWLTDNFFVDDLTPYKGQNPLYKIVFKYFIEAYELEFDNSVATMVRTRELIVEILPGVIMPNSIAPTSQVGGNGRLRSIFEPIISFDARFELTIYDRWGGVIYHGNEGWNGKNSKGEYVKEGVYPYRIVVNTSDLGDVVKTGTLSVVYPPK